MKVKSSFVTNSSSTSFIIFLPMNFDVKEFFHLTGGWGNSDDRETIIQFLESMIEDLKKESIVGQDDYDFPSSFGMLCDIFRKLNLVITSWESGPESGMIININSKEVKDNIEVIKKGGWGVKHGGWGRTSE